MDNCGDNLGIKNLSPSYPHSYPHFFNSYLNLKLSFIMLLVNLIHISTSHLLLHCFQHSLTLPFFGDKFSFDRRKTPFWLFFYPTFFVFLCLSKVIPKSLGISVWITPFLVNSRSYPQKRCFIHRGFPQSYTLIF